MHFSSSIVLLALSAAVSSAAPSRVIGRAGAPATPTQTEVLTNGWPSASANAVNVIEILAGGTLSDAGPPPNPGSNGVTSLQLVAFNELFEVAFFSDLLFNITTNVPGYLAEDLITNIPGAPTNTEEFRDYVIEALIAVVAQEQLHVLNANDALSSFGVAPIDACDYTFPVEDFQSAIALAGTFTDLVLGTLQDVEQIFAQLNASGLVRGVSSIIGQEGEQEGFYRLVQGKRPSSAAFLTISVRDFAFTALQGFVVPGSCPNENTIPLTVFGTLNLLNADDLKAENGTAQFSVLTSQGAIDASSSVVYISGQNLPVTVPITNFTVTNGLATFAASFPFAGDNGVGLFNDGLTIAAVAAGSPTFANADAVAKAAIFGPALIEIETELTIEVIVQKATN